MKAGIHPKTHPVVFVDISTEKEFIALSTLTSDKKKKINGVDHYVIRVDVSSDSHPFYTGKQKLIDTAGRVDKFRARMEKAKKYKEEMDKKTGTASDEGAQEEAKADDVAKEQEVAEQPEVTPVVEEKATEETPSSEEK